MTMIPRERVPYSAIIDRPKMKLPNDSKIIVWTIVNLEVWDISKPMARQVIPAPTGAGPTAWLTRNSTPSARICSMRRSIWDFSILKSGMP